MSQPEVCVVFNPSSGRGRASRRLDRLLRAWEGRAVFRPTAGPGQAEELALQAAREGFAVVAAAGGDGTVHEVANGILRAGRPEVVLAVLPAGSANDYAHSLGLDVGWWRHFDAVASHAVDVGIARVPGRNRFFVNGLGLGFNGTVTRESRRIRRLQGPALYGLAVLRTLCFHFALPSMEVSLDDGKPRRGPTLSLSLALGQREGNFVVAPQAVLDDGLFDYVHAGAISRWGLVRLLPRLFLGRGLPHEHSQLWLGRCRRLRLCCESALTVHTDGELFCLPGDGVQDLEVELLPGALRVLGKFGR